MLKHNSLFTLMMCYCSKMDYDDFETYDIEDSPDFRLRDGLDLTKLQLGEGQEFEVDLDDANKGKVSLHMLACFLLRVTSTQCSDSISSSVNW